MSDTEGIVANPHPFAMVSYELLALSGNALKLYVLLSRYADNATGLAWPSRATLAAELGYKQARAVDPLIAELEGAGAITVTRRTKPGSKEAEKNLYTVKRTHEITPVEVPAGGSAQKRTTPQPEVVRENAPRSAQKRTRVVRENAQELITNELITNELRVPAADAPGQAELIAVAQPDSPATPEEWVAKRAYDNTSGALNFMAVKGIAKWAIHTKGCHPRDVDGAIGTLWRAGRTITKQVLGQYLDGIIKSNGTTRPDTMDKIRHTLTVPLTAPAPAGALTGTDPFQLRITQ